MNLSHRAQKLILEKKNAYNNDSHYITININQQNKQISSLSYHQCDDSVLTLVFESLCFLLINRSISRLFNLDFKELESFLRDDNLTPSSDNSTLILLEETFQKVKLQILVEALKSIIVLPVINIDDEFMVKFRRDHDVINLISKEILNEEPFLFLAREYEFIYIKTPKHQNLSLFISIIEDFYQNVVLEDIKVVAV